MKKNQKYYWNPVEVDPSPVNKTKFIHTFSEEQQAGTWNGWHSHKGFSEFMYVLEGTMVMCTEESTFYAQGNNGVWIPENVKHEWYLPVNSSNRSLFIHNSVIPKTKEWKSCRVLEINPLLRELICAVHEANLDGFDENSKRLGLVLRDRLMISKGSYNALPMPKNHALVELCSEALVKPIDFILLSDWSSKLNISEKTLTRLFIKETGLNFRAWQKRLRIHKAKIELERGQSVTDVSLICGYNSLSSFSSAFKSVYGINPKEVIANIKPNTG